MSSVPAQLSDVTSDSFAEDSPTCDQPKTATLVVPDEITSQASRGTNEAELYRPRDATPPPLNTTPPSQKAASLPLQTTTAPTLAQRSISLSMGNLRAQGEDSPVMNETLSVIDEHIIDLNTPGSSLRASERRGTNDSGSEYSSHIDHRLSYIAGHETDEEEGNLRRRQDVKRWTPSQVAQGLLDMGVEGRHCEVFKEQEITGEVLLSMDQTSLMLKEFDLGVVGRRLRTWQMIRKLQDDVRRQEKHDHKRLNSSHGETSSDDFELGESQSSVNGSILPSIPQLSNRPGPKIAHSRQDSKQEFHNARQEFLNSHSSHSSQLFQHERSDIKPTPVSFTLTTRPGSPARPSAASIREFNHSRRHSSVDFAASSRTDNTAGRLSPTSPNRKLTSSHQKTPSLDRGWTMGSPVSVNNTRPLSAVGTRQTWDTDHNTFDPDVPDSMRSTNLLRDVDRGYASGGDVETKKTRNVLRKRDVASASHSRQSSNIEEQRRASIAGSRRHSRFGSVDSIRDTVTAMTSPALKMYHGNSLKGKFRNSSANETTLVRATPSNELTSPTVTKLEYSQKPSMSIVTSSPKLNGDSASSISRRSSATSPGAGPKPRMGLRAISDAVTGSERALVTSPTSVPSPIKESTVHSPTRTGSTTTSGASVSLDIESTDASSKGTNGTPTGLTPTGLTPTSGTRRKTKKDTSAYVRGLELKSPQEQMIGCDYNGWMKKKSSNLMTTWKPRLFVLRGRRLSYYYSENDTQEKGLIDISSHRVLPANSDLITSLHATVTGAKSSPVSPSNAHAPTIAATEAAAEPESTLPKNVQKINTDSMFIFKLVPPRTGLSRAVNFTKPTVHYFAVDNITQGRLWMAALMKATIDRDETKPITTTYQQKTISLAKARAMRHRPPALMGLDERAEALEGGPKSDETGLMIQEMHSEKIGGTLDRTRTGSLNVLPRSASTPAVED